MNHSAILIGPVNPIHFLSIYSYIQTLNNIFHEESFIKEKEASPIRVINAYYKYLNQSYDETKAKEDLIQKLLKGSDLYGGKENETLDKEYIDATFAYIVSKVVFAKYGTVYGYLAEMVTISKSVKLSNFKQTLFRGLKQLTFFNSDESISRISKLARTKIRDTILLPLFPTTEKDMYITDINYIYAQAGFMFTRKAYMKMDNFTFDDYITMSQVLEISAIQNNTEENALEIFTLPALLFYAHKERKQLRKQNIAHLMKREHFWQKVFLVLFSYLKKSFQKIHHKVLKSTPLYQFYSAMSKYKTRTKMGRSILRKMCPPLTENDYADEVEHFKSFSSNQQCPNNKSISLPNLEELYNQQVSNIEKIYRLHVKVSVDEVFRQANLHNSIDSTKTTVYEAEVVPTVDYCTPQSCPQISAPLKPNVYLYGLRREDEEDCFYALVNNNNSFSLLDYQKNKSNFLKEVGLPKDSDLRIYWFFPTKLKETAETFTNFVDNVADIIAKQFGELLFRTGYEETVLERTVSILLAFVPFYHCITNSIAGKKFEASVACVSDAIAWIPLIGQLTNIGVKLSTVALKQFFVGAGISLETFTTRQLILLTLTTGFREVSVGLSQTFTNVIFTRNMLKSLSLSVVRAIDPGFELLGKIFLSGKTLIGKVMKFVINSSKKLSSTELILLKYESIFNLNNKLRKSVDSSKIVRLSVDHTGGHIFRYTYPGGKNPCGPKYIVLSSRNAELRKIVGFKTEQAVIISRILKNGKVYYRKVDLKTEKPYGLELELNKNNVLKTVRPSYRKQLAIVKKEGLSGRGAGTTLKIRAEEEKAEESILNAAEKIAKSNLGFDKSQAENIIRHYSLATDIRSVQLDDLLDGEKNLPSGSTNIANSPKVLAIDIDDMDNIIFEKYVGQNRDVESVPVEDLFSLEDLVPIDKNFIVNIPENVDNSPVPAIMIGRQNEHLSVSVPTYDEFVENWLKTGRIAEKYKKWFLSSPGEINSLLYNPVLDNLKINDLHIARNRIAAVYGESYKNINVRNLLNVFVQSKKYRFANFEDYTALFLWKRNDFPNINENKDVKKALYRFSVRQMNEYLSEFSTTYYYSVRRNFKEVNQEIEKNLRTKDFFEVTLDERAAIAEQYWRRHPALHSSGNIKDTKLIVFAVSVDHKYLVVNLKNFFSEKASFISPGIQFRLVSVDKRTVRGKKVIYVKLRGETCFKENWLAYVMNEIDMLQ